jgi:hypothetical protein
VASTGTATGLTNGGHYTFKVAAASNRGTGAFSTATAPVIVGLPGPATHLALSPANTGITVRFTAAPANGSAINSYQFQVYDRAGFVEGGTFSKATTQTAFGLVNGHAYRLRLIAQNGAGAGPPSAFSPSVVAGTPAAPIAPHATPGNGRATIHWTAAASNGAAITEYVITPYLGGVAQPAQRFTSTATTETVTGLKNAKAYTFRIAATNSRGTGPRSTTPTITVGTPAAPAKVSATPGHAKAAVHWLAPNNSGSPITGYAITPYLGTTPQTTRIFHSAATSETVTGLTSGSQYSFTVAAINGRGTGPKSAPSNKVVIN